MTRAARLKRLHQGDWALGAHIAHRLHVGLSNRAVIYACRERLNPRVRYDRRLRDQRHALYGGALAAHVKNRELYRYVTGQVL